jgi:hypothetical protein
LNASSPNAESLLLSRKTFSWHGSCSRDHRHARKTQCKGWKCPRRHLPSERRLPLRQPPAEQPFSASPRNWNPVSNGWVLPHLESINFFCFICVTVSIKRVRALSQSYFWTYFRGGQSATNFVTLTVTFSVFLTTIRPDLNWLEDVQRT